MALFNYNGVNVLQLTNFFNTLITEEQLDQQIRSTQDLSLLCCLLEIKLQLINNSKHSLINYPIDFILKKSSSTHIDELCHTTKIALKIQADASEYLKLLKCISTNLASNIESLQYLKLLEVALVLCKYKREEEAFIKYTDCNRFDIIINTLINTDNKAINNFLNVNILPEYLCLNSESSRHLFAQILKHSVETKNLDIFCAIPQLFIDNNDVLLKDDCFWYILQTGLNNKSSAVQKQALYLLKRAFTYCWRHDNFSTESRVVSWNSACKKEVSSAWHNLFILYEVARERQLHLIEPIYQLIPTVKILHPSWLSSIFRILLQHAQQAVCTYTLLDLLKSNWYSDDAVFKDLVKCVICVLNKTEFALHKSIWMHLSKCSRNLSNEQFIVLLEESANISWIPPVCYLFYNTIFTSKANIFIPIPLCKQLLCNLRKLPHKYIRHECLRITIDYVQKAHFQHAEFNNYLELNKIFFKDNFQLWQQHNLHKFIPDIEKTIQTWIGNEIINLKDVEAILKIILNLKNDNLVDLLYKLFMNNQLRPAIQDRLCMLFYYRNKSILPYINSRLSSIQESDDPYLSLIAPLLKPSESKEILKTCLDILSNDKSNEIQTEISFTIINSLLTTSEIKDTIILEEILLMWEKIFLYNQNCNLNTCLCFIQVFSKSRLNSAIDQNQCWKIMQIFENILETQDFAATPEIFAQLKHLINATVEVETLFPFIDLCTRKLLELKGGAFFKVAAENFVNSILLNNVILYSGNESVLEKCGDLLRLLFDWINSCEDIGYSLSKNLRKLSELNSEVAFKFIPVGLKLLVFGDILKKDQRAEYNVCQLISRTNIEKAAENPNLTKIAIRGEMIKYVQNILNNICNENRAKKADAIAALLLKKYSIYINQRCFSDSHVHLIKLRILQALLLVHEYMENQEDLIDALLNSLCTESHQLSNKFIIIWLLIKLLYVKDNCLELIASKIESTSKTHSSTIFAFIPILYHVALLKNDDTFWFQVFKQLLPWTMGAHFNLRLYAQVGIKKLYDVLCQMENKDVCAKFQEIVQGVTEVLDKTEREVETIDKYIFDVFKPITDFNRRTIYYIIPHITNVTNDEYENILNILNCTISKSPNLDYLRTVQLKSTKQANQSVVSTSIIQKKIIPQDGVNRKTGELIVVASLIDKIPNLGGLSRTSEVFGVKELAINSLSTTKNPEFRNLSMSSENWINFAEVRIEQLQSYLLSMKEKGYYVVGAEQTSESVKLNNFKFPFKCLLLLGNEKEGIPPNLLSLIDACVEIPQLGVVRSLNVHVAAATFIWEYTKVHTL